MGRGMLLWIAALWDAAVGDPAGWPHPVRALGALIVYLEAKLRRLPNLLLAGGVLCLAVVAAGSLAAAGLYLLAARIHPWAGRALWCVLAGIALAGRSLWDESRAVELALLAGDLPAAREKLSWIVGRDVERLDAAGVARAAVETVAENTTDGVISALFYLMLGLSLDSPALALLLCWGFKAASTLDSMVGYKNEKYILLGRASARLDDVLNYIPARLTALLLCAVAPWGRKKKALAIVVRDHAAHASPNSAWAEAAVAGALGLRLGGADYYKGKLVEKPTIGDAERAAQARDIRSARHMMAAAAVLMLVLWSLGRIIW